MIVLEITEDKFGKVMKAVSKITEHAECLKDIFEEMTESGVRHIDHLCSIRQGDLVGDVFFNVSAYLADSSGL